MTTPTNDDIEFTRLTITEPPPSTTPPLELLEELNPSHANVHPDPNIESEVSSVSSEPESYNSSGPNSPTLINPLHPDAAAYPLQVEGPLPHDWFGLGFLRPTRPPQELPNMSNSSFSLRQTPAIDTTAPVWTHTSNPAVNHELDSLKAIWYTLKDHTDTEVGTSPPSHQRRLSANNELVFDHIKKRVATIRIGAIKGWKAVPNSEVQKDFKALGMEDTAAAQLAIAPTQHSFRSNTSGRGRRRSNKSTKK